MAHASSVASALGAARSRRAVPLRLALRAARTAAPRRLERTNFRGRTVSLAGGPGARRRRDRRRRGRRAPSARTAAAAAGRRARRRAPSASTTTWSAPARAARRQGLRGHLGALREGRVTSGLVKIAGVGAAGLAAAALLAATGRARAPRGRRARVDVLLGAGVIAGTANLLNLLDLRPGPGAEGRRCWSARRWPPAAAAGVAAGAARRRRRRCCRPTSASEIMLGDAAPTRSARCSAWRSPPAPGRSGRAGAAGRCSPR